MEFWGVEVKAGEPLKVEPEAGMIIHLSQASLGETKSKGNETVLLSAKLDDKKFVLGNLSLDKFPQLSFDLVFEKEFELSHNWKNGSIFLLGYQSFVGEQDEFGDYSSDSESDEEEEEDIPPNALENGKGGLNVELAKPAIAKSNAAKPEASEKPKVKVVEPSKGDEDDDTDSEDDESDDDDEDSEDISDEDMLDGVDDDDDESDEEDDEETPKKLKPESGKKRANDSAVKTPVSAKKAKLASPKTDGKKGGHTATPHPAKKGAKSPATADKSKPQTPKSAGGFSCKSCSKSFGSDKALDSHTKAKHG